MSYLADAFSCPGIGLHLAVFAEPYLSKALCGEKTIESRFSRNRCAPYDAVGYGDILLLKAVGGPICGLARVRRAWFYDLSLQPLTYIRDTFGEGIGAGEDFWAARCDAAFATLIELTDPIAIDPVACGKRDRRGWVSLRDRQMAFSF
jgi:hypothetical protein